MDYHAVDDTAPVAVVAEQGSFEVVLVNASPFPGDDSFVGGVVIRILFGGPR